MTVYRKILLAMTCIVVLITVGVSSVLYLMQRHSLIAGIDEKLRIAAIMARAILPPDYHDRITGPDSVSGAQFLNIVERNNQLCRQLGLEYLWSLMVVDGKIVFTTSTSPDKVAQNGKHAKFFEVHSNPELYIPTFAKMRPTYQINDDKWGRIRVALIPYRDRKGRPYLFGASVHLTDLDRQLHQIIRECLTGSLLLFSLSTLLSFMLARFATRPIQQLTATIQSITQGDSELIAEERGSYEQVVLAHSFNRMQRALRQSHDELEQRVQERTLELARTNEALQQKFAEHERAEDALRQSEARYRSLFENSLDGILLTVPSGPIKAANPAACTMFGRTEDEICQIGRPAVVDETDPRFPQIRDERALTGRVFGEINCVRKDGTTFPAELMSVVMPGGLHSFVIIRDITMRKRAEAALRESEARLNAALESIPFDFWFMDASSRYVMQNRMSVAHWGSQVGRTLDDVVLPPETMALWRANNRRALQGEIVTGEYQHHSDEGERVYYNIIGPVRLEDRIIGILGVNIDVTERDRIDEALRTANSQLAEADRRKDEFLAMLAHELRNPLAPIRTAVQLLRQSDLEASILERQHDIIERQVTHMAHLLDDLLDISRITHGKIELKKQPLSVATVMTHALETAMPLIQARRHTLEFTPPPAMLCVKADLDRLSQALGNLLSNAAKYTEAGGQIWLEAQREDGEIVICVRDTGLGIDAEAMAHIFDLFAQAERSLDRAQGGLGIGLTLARNLVQLHGGTLDARSAGLGQGSEFIIRLPAWSGDLSPEDVPAEPIVQPGSTRRRILVVDDVVDTAESMVELLESWDHEARAAYDGSSAVDAVREFRPDTVLLDIGLPGMNGYEVARRLRAEYGRSLLLVALTGYGQESDREQAIQAGFDHHMTKPVDLRALSELMRDRD